MPSWAKDSNVGYRMINARAETVTDRPAFRAAFARRRCLLPADAYYEWQLLHTSGEAQPGTSPVTDPEHRSRKAKTRKRPFAVRYADGILSPMDGLALIKEAPPSASSSKSLRSWTASGVDVVIGLRTEDMDRFLRDPQLLVPTD